ncbi:MAG TPA: hypothetical protein VIY73_06835 [Polyangiaceae bacterium]
MSGVRTRVVRARHRGWVAALVFAAAFPLAAACGGKTTAPGAGASGATAGNDASAPGWADEELGVYGSCAFSDFGMVSGSGGEMTLTRLVSGEIQAVFASDAGTPAVFTLAFHPTSGTSATLEPAGQPMPWEGFCWSGTIATDAGLPIDPAPTDFTLDLTSGALTYDADTLYLSVVGTPDIDAECEVNAGGSITCARGAQ